MKLTVLTDNNTYIDEYYLGEPALSVYIEDGNKHILFDTGYSDIYLRNAEKMGIDLSAVSTVIFSHGHNDHTGGIEYLLNKYPMHHFHIVAHPDALRKRTCDNKEIGFPQVEKIHNYNETLSMNLTKHPVSISENIIFLGEIPASNNFEHRQQMGCFDDSESDKDFVMDDSALVYHGDKGLFVITGCSHSGICNIIEYAKRICNEDTIIGVIGGFHLFEQSDRLSETINYFKSNNITNLYPCHCISFQVKAEIHKQIPIQEVGVGMSINIQ